MVDKFNHDSFPARWQVKLKQTITVHELYAYQHIILDESFNKVTLLNFRGGGGVEGVTSVSVLIFFFSNIPGCGHGFDWGFPSVQCWIKNFTTFQVFCAIVSPNSIQQTYCYSKNNILTISLISVSHLIKNLKSRC